MNYFNSFNSFQQNFQDADVTLAKLARHLDAYLDSVFREYDMQDNPAFKRAKYRARLGRLLKQWEKLPDSVTIYRVLYLEELSDFNQEELGFHWVARRKDINQELTESIADTPPLSEDNAHKFYVVTARTAKDGGINWGHTFKNNVLFETEFELSVDEPEFVTIEPYLAFLGKQKRP